MNGRRLPLRWPGMLRAPPQPEHQNVSGFLDAAVYVETAQLHLSEHDKARDLVALSFCRFLAFSNLGVLVVRKDVEYVP